jgi:BirA family biotin operon repressor/biotin-[acetyl-CoA-carboxylase] ligase
MVLPRVDANVVWFDDVDSTNAVAGRMLRRWEEGEQLPFQETVFVAGAQRAGRGRDGRAWLSPRGGVYATWTTAVAPAQLALVPLAAAVALAAGVESLVEGIRVALKWPNDLLLDGRKLGGVLSQARTRGDRAWVAVGFGLNVAASADELKELGQRAINLRDVGYAGGAEDAVNGLLGIFLSEVWSLLDAPRTLRASWTERALHALGEPVRLRVGDSFVEGLFRGLSADGRLVLEIAGEERRFTAGEVVGPLCA